MQCQQQLIRTQEVLTRYSITHKNQDEKLIKELCRKIKLGFQRAHKICTESALYFNGSQSFHSFGEMMGRMWGTCEPDNLSCSMSSGNSNISCSCCCKGNSQSILFLCFWCFTDCSHFSSLWCWKCKALFDLEPSKNPFPPLWFLNRLKLSRKFNQKEMQDLS